MTVISFVRATIIPSFLSYCIHIRSYAMISGFLESPVAIFIKICTPHCKTTSGTIFSSRRPESFPFFHFPHPENFNFQLFTRLTTCFRFFDRVVFFFVWYYILVVIFTIYPHRFRFGDSDFIILSSLFLIDTHSSHNKFSPFDASLKIFFFFSRCYRIIEHPDIEW